MWAYRFLRGRHSLGKSPGDFGVRRSDGVSFELSRLHAARSSGGGIGFTFFAVVGNWVLELFVRLWWALTSLEPVVAILLEFVIVDLFIDKSWGLSWIGSAFIFPLFLNVFSIEILKSNSQTPKLILCLTTSFS